MSILGVVQRTGIAYTTQVSFGPHRMHDVCGSLVAITERAEPGTNCSASSHRMWQREAGQATRFPAAWDWVGGAAQRIAGGMHNAAEQAGHVACRAHNGVGEVRGSSARSRPEAGGRASASVSLGRLGSLIPTGGSTRRS